MRGDGQPEVPADISRTACHSPSVNPEDTELGQVTQTKSILTFIWILNVVGMSRIAEIFEKG